jgi:hypothetical protein
MGWTESYAISYHSTEIVTITSTVPCPVTTSYTTTYVCSSCGPCKDCGPLPPPTRTVCSQKSCSAGPSSAESTDFAPGESATAQVLDSNRNALNIINIPANECPEFFAFISTRVDVSGLAPCTTKPPPPPAQTLCQASPCIASVYLTNAPGASFQTETTILSGSAFPNGQLAPPASSVAGQQLVDASDCTYSLLPDSTWAPGYAASITCGARQPVNQNSCGVSVIGYNYVSNGQTYQTATTVPQHGCGPYNNLSGSGAVSGPSGARLVLAIWTFSAVLSAAGMLLL